MAAGSTLRRHRKAAGIGRALLSKLIELLERQGFVAVIGAIALPNEASVALHERLGFVQHRDLPPGRVQARRVAGCRAVATRACPANGRAVRTFTGAHLRIGRPPIAPAPVPDCR